MYADMQAHLYYNHVREKFVSKQYSGAGELDIKTTTVAILQKNCLHRDNNYKPLQNVVQHTHRALHHATFPQAR